MLRSRGERASKELAKFEHDYFQVYYRRILRTQTGA